MKNFIQTQDEETAIQLRSLGFTELPKQGSFFIFINDGKANFTSDEKKKLVYTNILSM